MGSPGTGVGWGLLDYKTEKYVMTRNWRVGALQLSGVCCSHGDGRRLQSLDLEYLFTAAPAKHSRCSLSLAKVT